MTIWLTTDDILMINARFVGPDKLRDFGLLESAVCGPRPQLSVMTHTRRCMRRLARCCTAWPATTHLLTANKRTAWASTAVFYQLNGYVDTQYDPGHVVGLVVDVAEGQIDVPNIAATLKGWTQPFPAPAEWIDDDDPDSKGGRHYRD